MGEGPATVRVRHKKTRYYAATVLSMLQSWHTFFFVSFDPGGFVTVDKPPLGFWIQAASARLLGFSGLSILLPEALAGVASVAVLYAGKFLVAVFINRALMVSGLRLGFFCNIRATVPETTGVAMLVPLSRKYLAVPELVEPV